MITAVDYRTMSLRDALWFVCERLESVVSATRTLWDVCPVCRGIGTVAYWTSTARNSTPTSSPCSRCRATGRVPRDPDIGRLMLAAKKNGIRLGVHSFYDSFYATYQSGPDRMLECDTPDEAVIRVLALALAVM